ncbi:MAG: 2Fe-2S iron-sulfur cluster binding domain-containing protein [Chitinophagaceae bacterium]|nr:MAG: 2Fe-2S iron-sulfur cluster binding domain-containing protein [Chitinophagaceae bacterium]
MLKFILNDEAVAPTAPAGTLLLDYIRYNKHLTGTKVGCREGDCGACTIMVGELKNGQVVYHTATSCLMPIGNAVGKHIVTIEGLNVDGLNVVQEAFVQEGATQCGFCTPGFIVSLAAFCVSSQDPTHPRAVDAVNGNICRCTGYKSIERAVANVQQRLHNRRQQDVIGFATQNNFVPTYFSGIAHRLSQLQEKKISLQFSGVDKKNLGGGTDLYVQQHEQMADEDIHFLLDDEAMKEIKVQDGICQIGGAVTAAQLACSPVFQKYFREWDDYIKLISSTQIRNMATVAGNICNASPIGDFSIFFLALDAKLHIGDGKHGRTVPLRNFYQGYKKMDLLPGEVLEKISFQLPADQSCFNFEKVCKRTHLDIATVNTAMHLVIHGDVVTAASLSAGGVAPVPYHFSNASKFLIGKQLSPTVIAEFCSMLQGEINPISDVRGSADYKRLLLQQLVKAHFLKFMNAVGSTVNS